MLPTFRFAWQLQVMALLLRELRQRGMAIADELFAEEYDLYGGDLTALGKGEVLLRHPFKM